MRRSTLFLAVLTVLALLPGLGAFAATDHTGEAKLGAPYSWTGTTGTGVNLSSFTTSDDAVNPAGCAKDVQNYCDTVLVAFTNPVPADATKPTLKETGVIDLTAFTPVPGPISDYDVHVYNSNAQGAKLAETVPFATADATNPDTPGASDEHIVFDVITTKTQPTNYYLLEVVYFTSVQGSYAGRASLI